MDFNINLTNFQDHPTNRRYKVFSFTEPERANYFEQLLIEHKIEFEKDAEESENRTHFLFGVHERNFKQALNLNYLAIGRYRSKFIPDVTFRYFVIVISLAVLTLAILGAILSN